MRVHYQLIPLRILSPLLSIAALTSGYIAAFEPLYALVGYGVGGLVFLPVLLTGRFYGMWLGLLAGLFAFVLNAMLFTSIGETGWSMMLQEGAPGIVAVIALGIVIGQMHDRAVRLEAQVARLRAERDQLRQQLTDVELRPAPISLLRGIVTICASCKRIREQEGKWKAVERYISERSELLFSHGLCRECMYTLYPDEAC